MSRANEQEWTITEIPMNTYEVEVVVRYKFNVTAHDPYEAYREAQEWDEYFTNSEVQSMTISPVCEPIVWCD